MRAPYQVLVIAYRIKEIIEYALFSRRDMDCYQWISGGGEDFDRDVLASAKREAFEEAGIPLDTHMVQLDSRTTIPVEHCGQKDLLNKGIYVVYEYAFGVDISNHVIELSKEHKSFEWVSYDKALKLLKYDSNKTALYELDKRIKCQTLNQDK